MWLLDASGVLTEAPEPTEAAHFDADGAILAVPQERTVHVRFGATADGRGFSIARQLRARGYSGKLIAEGPLIPDQARHAFQSGFDGVAVSEERLARHGEDAWRNAVARSVPELYVADSLSRGPEKGLWAARHAQ